MIIDLVVMAIAALALLLLGFIAALVFGRDDDAVETFVASPEWPLRPYWWADVHVPRTPPLQPQLTPLWGQP